MDDYQEQFNELIHDVTHKMNFFKHHAWSATAEGNLDRRLGFNYGMHHAAEELQQLINKYQEQ